MQPAAPPTLLDISEMVDEIKFHKFSVLQDLLTARNLPIVQVELNFGVWGIGVFFGPDILSNYKIITSFFLNKIVYVQLFYISNMFTVRQSS